MNPLEQSLTGMHHLKMWQLVVLVVLVIVVFIAWYILRCRGITLAGPCQSAANGKCVAIVGAGVAASWLTRRLTERGYQVLIAECSEQIGGRLLTRHRLQQPVSSIAKGEEYGGMRFFPEQQPLVVEYANELKLNYQAFPLSVPGNEVVFSYKKRVPLADYPDVFVECAQQLSRQQLHDMSITEVLAACGKTPEEIQLYITSNGYRFVDENISAELWYDEETFLSTSGPQLQYMVTGNGYQSMVVAGFGQLQELQYLDKCGGVINGLCDFPTLPKHPVIAYHHQLEEIECGPEHSADDQECCPDQTEKVTLKFTNGNTWTVDLVILTMQAPQLAMVRGIKPEVRDLLLTSFVPCIGEKLFINYPCSWWEDLGITGGRDIFPNSELGTVYFYSPGTILVYNAGASITAFWEEKVKTEGVMGAAKYATRQLSLLLYGRSEARGRCSRKGKIPQPVGAGFKTWLLCMFWKPKINQEKAAATMRRPCGSGQPVYWTSDAIGGGVSPGWVQGSLQSAKETLALID